MTTIESCTFNNNSATRGGAVFLYATPSLFASPRIGLSVKGSTFTLNKVRAVDVQAAMTLPLTAPTRVNLQITHCNWPQPVNRLTTHYSPGQGEEAAALYLVDIHTSIKSSKFLSNAGSASGAIQAVSTSGNAAGLLLESTVFEGNSAEVRLRIHLLDLPPSVCFLLELFTNPRLLALLRTSNRAPYPPIHPPTHPPAVGRVQGWSAPPSRRQRLHH